jgi:hypothetical protein
VCRAAGLADRAEPGCLSFDSMTFATLAATLMHEAGVPVKRAQEILGHASERTTLSIYTHSMRCTHNDSADKIEAFAGLSPSFDLGSKVEKNDSVESEENGVKAPFQKVAVARRCRMCGAEKFSPVLLISLIQRHAVKFYEFGSSKGDARCTHCGHPVIKLNKPI